MKKAQFIKEAEKYIEASQRLKAAQEALAKMRERVILGFDKFVEADKKGVRTVEFDDSKIVLSPRREVSEKALKRALGPDLPRFIDKGFAVSLSAIQAKYGEGMAQKLEKELHGTVSKVLGKSAPRGSVVVMKELNKKAAVASLDPKERHKVKYPVGETLRPYPPQEGRKGLLKAALTWLKS